MDTKNMGYIYEEIANKLNEIIPDEWTNIYLYVEVLDDSREVYFYFDSINSNDIVYGHDIPITYNVDKKIYRQLLKELMKFIVDLHVEYKENNNTIWTNLTFLLDSSGKFNINFNYDDILNSSFSSEERHIIWKYQVLDIQPTNENHKGIISRYLNSKNKDDM